MFGSQPLPPGWADDPLSDFIKQADQNTYATFVRMKKQYAVLLDVDKLFSAIGENLNNSPSLVSGLLLLRSHSAYRGATRLAMSGQVIEAFPVLRSCLEYALYALHIFQKPETAEIWFRRHDNEASLRASKSEFTFGNVTQTLANVDPENEKITRLLYERTIDYGGHPNERSVTSSLIISDEEDAKIFQQVYMTGDPLPINHALKTTAQVGLCSLYILRNIFRGRFDLLGITEKMNNLRSGL